MTREESAAGCSPQTPDELLALLPPSRLAALIEAILAAAESENREGDMVVAVAETGVVDESPDTVAPWLYGLFKLLADPECSRARWEALQAEIQDKDYEQIVLDLWRILERHYGPEVEEHMGSLIYHRSWLFEWLSSRRYDLRRARRALGAGRWLSRVHYFLALGLMAVLVLRRMDFLALAATFASIVGVLLVYAVAAGAQARRFRAALGSYTGALVAAVNSLIPRLAGASAVGLVALASSEELLKLVVEAGERKLWPLWLALLVLGGYGYLLLEMGRRVHPLPRLRRLLGNGLDVLTTAFAHGTALVLITEGGLTRVIGSGVPFTWSQSLSVLVFIVTIGLIVNLIWAEQPVTEPL